MLHTQTKHTDWAYTEHRKLYNWQTPLVDLVFLKLWAIDVIYRWIILSLLCATHTGFLSLFFGILQNKEIFSFFRNETKYQTNYYFSHSGKEKLWMMQILSFYLTCMIFDKFHTLSALWFFTRYCLCWQDTICVFISLTP